MVVVGGGFGGLARHEIPSQGRRRGHARRPHEPPPLPAAALPGRDGDPLGGPDRAAAAGGSCASTRTSTSSWPRSPASISRTGRSLAVRPWGDRVDVPLRQPDRRPGIDDLVLRTRRPRPALPPDEDDRRRPQPATADLRGVRAGRDGAVGSRAPEVAHLRRRRWRADRLRGRGTDRRARATGRSRRTSARSTPRAPWCSSSTPTSRSSRAFGDRPVPEGHERARAHRRRGPHRDARDEHRRRRHGRRVPERPGAHRDAHGRLGGRRAGLAACAHPGRGVRSGVRPCGPGCRSTRLHAAGPPRGLRHRRRDDALRAPRRRRGRDAAGHLRRADDQAAPRRQAARQAVPLPRPRRAWPPSVGAARS